MDPKPFYGECSGSWVLSRPKAVIGASNFRLVVDLGLLRGWHRYWHKTFAIFGPMFLPGFRQPFTYLAHCDYARPQGSSRMDEAFVSAFFPRIFGGGLMEILEFPGVRQIDRVATYLDLAL